jgi:hypothetical protein
LAAHAPYDADQVVEHMCDACLNGVRLLSDRQPMRLRIDEHRSGAPAVWLHPDGSSIAWIIVDIGDWDWSKVAYQFGHELGHVLANSWQPHAKPGSPCQWFEEAMVEAFSVRILGRVTVPGDNKFGNAIADYRQNIIKGCAAVADEQGFTRDPATWFARHRTGPEVSKSTSTNGKQVAPSLRPRPYYRLA